MKRTIVEYKATGMAQITVADERWYSKTTYDQTTKQENTIYVPSVTWIAGFYPNQTLTAVGVAGGASTIIAITGAASPYTFQLAGNSTASATVTATGSVYLEAMLRSPYLSSAAA